MGEQKRILIKQKQEYLFVWEDNKNLKLKLNYIINSIFHTKV